MSLSKLKPESVATIPPDCVVAEAARLMTMFSVGALVIAESGDAKPLGIVTDRDLVKMIGAGLDPQVATVASLAGAPLETAPLDASDEELLERMRKSGVRRLPLVDSEGRLAGLVSLDDLLVWLGRALGSVAEAIEEEFRREHPVPSGHERAL